MALKSKIYKLKITLSDLERHYYDSFNITVAQHPSETSQRLMARILAFCLNADERLEFSKGLSVSEEPDIWAHSLDDQLKLWIDVGEPAFDRIKKATRIASAVKIYSFNSKSNIWWEQGRDKFQQLNVSVFQFDWEGIQAFAAFQERTMDISVTINDDSAYIATQSEECEVPWIPLQVG